MKRTREEMEVLSSSVVVTQQNEVPQKKEGQDTLYFSPPPILLTQQANQQTPLYFSPFSKSSFELSDVLKNLENPNVNYRLQAIELLLSSNNLLSYELTKQLYRIKHNESKNQKSFFEQSSQLQLCLQNHIKEHQNLIDILRRLLKVEINNEIKILLIRSLSSLSFSPFYDTKDILLDFFSLVNLFFQLYLVLFISQMN